LNLIQSISSKEKIKGLILDCRDIAQRKKTPGVLRAQKAKELFWPTSVRNPNAY